MGVGDDGKTSVHEKNSGCVKNTSDKDMIAANVDSGKAGEENSRVQSNTGTNGYDKDMAMKRKLSGESEPEEKAKKIRSEEPYSEDKELKKRKRSEDDNASEEKKKKKKKKHREKLMKKMHEKS